MLARYLKSNLIIDEFTSNLDRLTARSLSYTFHKYILKHKYSKIIVAGCNRDIISWLRPDWRSPELCSGQLATRSLIAARVYDVDTQKFLQYSHIPKKWSCCLDVDQHRDLDYDELLRDKYKKIAHIDEKQLYIMECKRERWYIYEPYHYLSSKLLSNCKCYEVFIKLDDIYNVAFLAIANLPSGTLKKAYREHRLVVLPYLQGTGIAIAISEYLGQHYHDQGLRYFAKTSHPKLGAYRNNSDVWRKTSANLRKINPKYPQYDNIFQKNADKLNKRLCYSHEYIGLKPDSEIDENSEDDNSEERQIKISLPVSYSKLEKKANNKNIDKTEKLDEKDKTDKTEKLDEKDKTDKKNKVKWRPLKVYGSQEKYGHDIRITINHTKKIFRAEDYANKKQLKASATEYLEKLSKEKKTNLYRIENDVLYLKVKDEVVTVDSDDYELIKNYHWSMRTLAGKPHFYCNTKGSRLYLEELLLGKKWHECEYKDGDTNNNKRKNLS